MKRITFLLLFFCSLGLFAQGNPDFSKGTFIVNEGWFGHDPGSINFIDEDGNFYEKVYENVNQSYLGNTSPYAGIFADKLFVISKQSYTNGGRFIVADGHTLEKIASFDDLNGADGRSFVGINPQKVYLATSSGITVFDVENLEVKDKIEGVTSGEVGNMIRTSHYVYAVIQNRGVVVIDFDKDELIKTFEGNYNGIVQAKDGSVWASQNNALIEINETDLSTNEVAIPEGNGTQPTWFAWHPGSFFADVKENVIYWINNYDTFNYEPNIIRFNVTDRSFDVDFSSIPNQDIPDKEIPYASALRSNPVTGELILNTTEYGFGNHYEKNWFHFIDPATGEITKTIQPEDYFWFPSMAFFPDNAAPEVSNLESEIHLDEGDEIKIDLKDKVSDADNNAMAIVKRISNNTNPDAVQAEINIEDELVLTYLTDGGSHIEITFDSNGKTVTHQIYVTTGDEAPLYTEDDVYYFVGEGSKTAYVVVDFNDGSVDHSFTWGVHFEGEDLTINDALLQIQEEDTNFSIEETFYEGMGYALDDIYYNNHKGVAGEPGYWATLTGNNLSDFAGNMGLADPLENGKWYGFTFDGFDENFNPIAPIFKYAAYNSDWLSLEDIEHWYGEGANQTIITLDFVNDEAETSTFAFGVQFSQTTLTAEEALEIIAAENEDLSYTINEGQLSQVQFKDLEAVETVENYWQAFIGSNMSDYIPAENGTATEIENGQIFGFSFGNDQVRRPYIPTIVDGPNLDVDGWDFAADIKIYPNPVVNELHVSSNNTVQQLQIFDMQGRLIMTNQNTTINVTELSSGNYFIKIIGENGSATKQFIKR